MCYSLYFPIKWDQSLKQRKRETSTKSCGAWSFRLLGEYKAAFPPRIEQKRFPSMYQPEAAFKAHIQCLHPSQSLWKLQLSLSALTTTYKIPPGYEKNVHGHNPERTQVIKNAISSWKYRLRRKCHQPWIISSLLWIWLQLDIPEIFVPPALVVHWASWSLCKMGQSHQVWEAGGRGWPSWSVVHRPLPGGTLSDLFITSWRRPFPKMLSPN